MSHKYPVRPEQTEELVDKLYKDSSVEEPGETLDNLILAQAKSALDDSHAASSKGFAQRIFTWQRYASVAATLVIAVTIGMIYNDNKSELSPESVIVLPSAQSKADVATESAPTKAEPQKIKVVAEEMFESAGAVLTDEVSPTVQEMAKPQPAAKKLERKKSLEVRSLMAPPPMLKQKTVAKESAPLEGSSDQEFVQHQLIEDIRKAIAAEDMVKAKNLWKLYLNQYSSEQAPDDLLRFFGQDFQIRQPE